MFVVIIKITMEILDEMYFILIKVGIFIRF